MASIYDGIAQPGRGFSHSRNIPNLFGPYSIDYALKKTGRKGGFLFTKFVTVIYESLLLSQGGSTLILILIYKNLQEWGAGIVSDNTNTNKNSTTIVSVLHLSKFVLEYVATRKLPKAEAKPWTRQPTVLMKMDIEGMNTLLKHSVSGIVLIDLR